MRRAGRPTASTCLPARCLTAPFSHLSLLRWPPLQAVDFVRKRLKAGEGLKSICEQMCDACLAPDLKGLCRGADNMSVIVVLFKKHARLGGFWSSLLAACGRSPAYNRMASSSETRRR